MTRLIEKGKRLLSKTQDSNDQNQSKNKLLVDSACASNPNYRIPIEGTCMANSPMSRELGVNVG